MQMMLEVAMGVMDMEDDKVTDVVLRIPNEDFTDGNVVIRVAEIARSCDPGSEKVENFRRK